MPLLDAMIENLNRTKHEFDFGPAFDSTDRTTPYKHRRILIKAATNHAAGIGYCQKGNRLYTNKLSLQNVKKQYRRLITPESLGYYELDIRCCHLAIISGATPHFPIIREILERGESVYRYLSDYGSKDRIKACICTMIYGAKEKMQQSSFSDHPKMKELLEEKKYSEALELVDDAAIQRWRRLTESAIYCELANGIQMLDPKIDVWGNRLTGSKKNNLHLWCTSYEAQLIYPIYELSSLLGYQIVLHQHDGLTIYTGTSKLSPELTIKEIKSVFNGKSKVVKSRVDIPTVRLEIKNG